MATSVDIEELQTTKSEKLLAFVMLVVRRGQCPFCAFQVHGNEHCEGCGREVIAPCARCERPRRVGATHCAVCGAR